jgi:hypothetical protein
MTPEEPGLLGNLPRSRPGTRSDKRGDASGSKPAPKRSQAAKPGVKNTAAAKKKAPAAKKKPAPKKAPEVKSQPAPKPRPEPVASKSVPPSPSPLESAVKVAGAGLKVAEGVTREVLRRLPRP